MGITRTIIIVWSWKAAGIGEGIWQVAGSANANDLVVCRDWPISQEGDTQNLAVLIRQYLQQDGEVMLFLHRYHGYSQEHLKQIIHQVPEGQQERLRCFLFGEGADAIYLTSDAKGLLGTSGTFSAQLNLDGQPLDVSALLMQSADFLRVPISTISGTFTSLLFVGESLNSKKTSSIAWGNTYLK